MSFLDEIFVPVTGDMIDLFGKSISLSRTSLGTYDPAVGKAPKMTSTQTISAIIEDYKGAELLSGLIQAGDKKVSIAGASVTFPPKPTDAVTVDGQAYAVQEVSSIYSGSLVALYVLKCRRS